MRNFGQAILNPEIHFLTIEKSKLRYRNKTTTIIVHHSKIHSITPKRRTLITRATRASKRTHGCGARREEASMGRNTTSIRRRSSLRDLHTRLPRMSGENEDIFRWNNQHINNFYLSYFLLFKSSLYLTTAAYKLFNQRKLLSYSILYPYCNKIIKVSIVSLAFIAF